ncbi:MAG: hypothetical protein R3D00_16655 [Bacteroidia bacterium]
MSDNNLFLIRDQVLPDSQNYELLRKTGIQHIQNLANRLWTDYNASDPGITLLEALCYGITDLGYRTAYDLKDLLTRSEKGAAIAPSGFHKAREILTNGPVTFNDLRKMLVDIEGVRNAWVEKFTDTELNGLYEVFLEFEEFVEDLKLGLKDRDNCLGEKLKGKYETPGFGKMRVKVTRDMLLRSLSVFPDCPGTVVVRLLNAGGEVLKTASQEVLESGVKTPISLNWVLVPSPDEEEDNYYILDAEGSTVNLYMNIGGIRVDCLAEIEGYAEIIPGDKHSGPERDNYYYFYDLILDFPEPGSAPDYPAKAVLGLSDYDKRNLEGEFLFTDGKCIQFDVERKLTLESVYIYGHKKGKVTVEVKNMAGNVVCCEEVVIKGEDRRTRVTLGCQLPPCQNYRIEARSETVKLYANHQADFPYSEPEVMILLGGMAGEYLEQEYYFFYDWEISFEKPVGKNIPSMLFTKTAVKQRALDKILSSRNLCEDLVGIKELRPEDIGICADIELKPNVDVEETMAEILFRMENFIKPPVRFYTLEEMFSKEKSVEEIFDGPALDHGFIDDEEFRKLIPRRPLRASDIIQELMDIPGVISVRNLVMVSFIDDRFRDEEKWELCPSPDPCRIPNFSPSRSNFIFYKNERPFYANADKALQILQNREAESFRIKHKAHQDNLPVPVGEDMELADHFPVQNDLPLNYMVGQYKVPQSASALRKGQAAQLKGFLLFFEQLFANYLAQLSHINDLFSWENPEKGDRVRTYFTQKLNETEIAGLPDLYAEYTQLQVQLEAIIETPEVAHERKLRFLEHLIARFGEVFTDYSLTMFGMYDDKIAVSRRIIEDKQAFLTDYPKQSSERGQAYDYRYPLDSENLSGLQRRVYRKLGIHCVKSHNLAGERLKIVADNPGEVYFTIVDEDGEILFRSISCPSKAAMISMLDFVLLLVMEAGKIAFRVEKCDHEWQMIVDCPGKDDQLVGVLANEEAREPVIHYLKKIAHLEGFHVVEHILLRERKPGDPHLPVNEGCDGDCPEVPDPYSFHASVIIPAWPRRFRNIHFRRLMEETIRMEAPAHVYLRICWIGHEQMRQFEQVLEKWECALADLTEEKHETYRKSMAALIDKLFQLENIYPPANLHDCESAGNDTPQFVLGQNNLDTLG